MNDLLINPFLFYLIEIVSRINIIFSIVGGVILIYTGIVTIVVVTDISNKDLIKTLTKHVKKCFIIGGIMFFIGTLMPSKNTCYKMTVASYITNTNIEKAKGEAYNLIDYIVNKIDELNDKEKSN